jgi:parvulin-like peptidyl-prolyl isomerase
MNEYHYQNGDFMNTRFFLPFIAGAYLLFLVCPNVAPGDELLPGGADKTGVADISAAPASQYVSLRIPFYSHHFAETPVALVNEEPVLMRELVGYFPYQHDQNDKDPHETEKEYLQLLQRLVNSRLMVEEAVNIGLDETVTFRNQLESFKIKKLQQTLIINHLFGLKPDSAEIEDLYQQISLEAKVFSLVFDSIEVVNRFRSELTDSEFDTLSEKYIAEGRAKKGEETDQYVKLTEFRPQVSQILFSMEVGDVSNVIGTEDGYIFFKLLDKRFVEDPLAEREAARIVVDEQRKQKALEYTKALQDKYVTVDQTLYDQLDFDQDFQQLKSDRRVLATVSGEEPVTITVADLAAELESKSFHGVQKAQEMKKLNERKEVAFSNMLFKHTAKLEARHLGFDQTDDFTRAVEEFKRSMLYGELMNKVVLPDVQLTPEEVREYYDENIEEYTSPLMLRMNSLVFDNRLEAESALEKLLKGADFKWVSANSSGLVHSDSGNVLQFDKNLLALTSLPEDLQEDAKNVKKGDYLLYAPEDGGFYYVLAVTDTYAPEAQPFEKVKQEVSRILFDQKAEKLQNEWIEKLKEVYPVEIFLIPSVQ